MFAARWTWLVPLAGASLVFAGVVGTTPPGFGAIGEVVFGSPRGPIADSDAYVLGAASSLALITLVVLAVVAVGIEFVLRLRRRGELG